MSLLIFRSKLLNDLGPLNDYCLPQSEVIQYYIPPLILRLYKEFQCDSIKRWTGDGIKLPLDNYGFRKLLQYSVSLPLHRLLLPSPLTTLPLLSDYSESHPDLYWGSSDFTVTLGGGLRERRVIVRVLRGNISRGRGLDLKTLGY